MYGLLKSLWHDEAGVSAVEYGLMAGLMAALLVTIMSTFSDKLEGLFDAIGVKIDKAATTVSEQTGTP
ncbi:MAG: Flp family type IVb pilin [Desulfatitalea sp.]|nr:Flp family type IVb pilin [Desulfatitalea sp.]NNK00478.1 Flp family type IVb pilin [Desulfatitalea sp.]